MCGFVIMIIQMLLLFNVLCTASFAFTVDILHGHVSQAFDHLFAITTAQVIIALMIKNRKICRYTPQVNSFIELIIFSSDFTLLCFWSQVKRGGQKNNNNNAPSKNNKILKLCICAYLMDFFYDDDHDDLKSPHKVMSLCRLYLQ